MLIEGDDQLIDDLMKLAHHYPEVTKKAFIKEDCFDCEMCICDTCAAPSDGAGVKYDSGKPRLGLIPPYAERLVAEVLTFGANKYAEDNWRKVDNAHKRYIDAALRHINAYRSGNVNDDESGLHHLAHAVCCLMFVMEFDNV